MAEFTHTRSQKRNKPKQVARSKLSDDELKTQLNTQFDEMCASARQLKLNQSGNTNIFTKQRLAQSSADNSLSGSSVKDNVAFFENLSKQNQQPKTA